MDISVKSFRQELNKIKSNYHVFILEKILFINPSRIGYQYEVEIITWA